MCVCVCVCVESACALCPTVVAWRHREAVRDARGAGNRKYNSLPADGNPGQDEQVSKPPAMARSVWCWCGLRPTVSVSHRMAHRRVFVSSRRVAPRLRGVLPTRNQLTVCGSGSTPAPGSCKSAHIRLAVALWVSGGEHSPALSYGCPPLGLSHSAVVLRWAPPLDAR